MIWNLVDLNILIFSKIYKTRKKPECPLPFAIPQIGSKSRFDNDLLFDRECLVESSLNIITLIINDEFNYLILQFFVLSLPLF